MSSMEVFVGTYRKVDDIDLSGIDEDSDELYDLENEIGECLIFVDDDLYAVESIADLSEYGFEHVIEPQDKPVLFLYWYNGGAGLHEVAESAIRKHLKSQAS